MGKRTYNNGSYVLKSPPLDPFYIEKDSDYHPNLRHYPDYRRLQYDSVKNQFVPKVFQPNPVKSTYQDDYDIQKNETEQFKDFKTVNCAKCLKPQHYRDVDVLLKENKPSNKKEKDEEEEGGEIIDDFDYENYEILPIKGVTDEDYDDEKAIRLSGPRSVTKILRREPRKPFSLNKFPNLTIYDTTYNRMAKVNDLPDLEKKIREKQKNPDNNKLEKNKDGKYMKFLNKKPTIYTCESSHFQNVIDESQVFHPFPNYPAPTSMYTLFHTVKGDFNSSYRVHHDNRKFKIAEPDIYQIRRQIFDEEKEQIKDVLKRNNDIIKGNDDINIYNP